MITPDVAASRMVPLLQDGKKRAKRGLAPYAAMLRRAGITGLQLAKSSANRGRRIPGRRRCPSMPCPAANCGCYGGPARQAAAAYGGRLASSTILKSRANVRLGPQILDQALVTAHTPDVGKHDVGHR